ncbi:DNA-binding response regulator [Planctomycetota bacterium]|nr:DNA-binding response regulator [Planctomycetota bacterium]
MPSVLLVEDEPAIADAATWALRRDGNVVVATTTVAEATAHLAGADLVVLDLGLPDGNGLDLLRRIRSAGNLPVIVLSARADEVDRIVGLELGADDYLAKPFSPRELSARVRAVLRRASSTPSAPQVLSIDVERQRATYRGLPVELTRQQFRLLVALAERPGAVLNRSRLLDLAWDEPGERFDRAVDSQVKLLRAALRAICPEPDPIETVRGEGYRLREDLLG